MLALLGGPGGFVYKRSSRGDTEVDWAAAHVLRGTGEARDFDPYGYDERQYCSPGFDLPVGRLTRAPHGEFPEYHTSADDLQLVRPERLAESLEAVLAVVELLERNGAYLNLSPRGGAPTRPAGPLRAPRGRRAGARAGAGPPLVLSTSDGRHTLLDVAERSNLPFDAVRQAADALLRRDLLAVAR